MHFFWPWRLNDGYTFSKARSETATPLADSRSPWLYRHCENTHRFGDFCWCCKHGSVDAFWTSPPGRASLLALVNGQAENLNWKISTAIQVLHHAAVSGICDILVFLINEAKYYKLNEEDGHRLFSVVPDTTIVIGINGVRDSARKFSSSMAQ